MRHRRRLIGLGRSTLLLGLGIGLLATASMAEQRKPKKPILPMIAIDNEGPIAVIRQARTVPSGEERRPGPPDERLFPWRSVIRLDLILPIRSGPWMPPAPPRRP